MLSDHVFRFLFSAALLLSTAGVTGEPWPPPQSSGGLLRRFYGQSGLLLGFSTDFLLARALSGQLFLFLKYVGSLL